MAELVHRLARLLAMVVLGSSAVFIILYLLRWEWNRALISGLFFLAAELYLLADLLLGRITGLERRMQQSEESDQIRALAAELRRTRPAAAGPFDWLAPDRDRTYVLVPILLGAGIILSGVAWVVERLSRVTAAPVAEHELARGLASMALPGTGLSPTGQSPVDDLDAPRPSDPGKRNAVFIGVLIVTLTVVITTLAIVLVTRPAPPETDAVLVLDVAVSRNNIDQSEEMIARSMWSACRLRMPGDVALQSLQPLAEPGQLRIVIAPAPAEFDRRELIGCLQDASADRAQVQVLSFALVER